MWKVPEENQIEIRIALIQHEGYDSHIITNDVSVLKLDEPLEFNEWANSSSFAVKWWKFSRYVQPLPLAPKGDDPAGGTICINSGHQKQQCVFLAMYKTKKLTKVKYWRTGWGSISHSSVAQMPNKLQVRSALFFIGPESDDWECLSVTHSLTD